MKGFWPSFALGGLLGAIGAVIGALTALSGHRCPVPAPKPPKTPPYAQTKAGAPQKTIQPLETPIPVNEWAKRQVEVKGPTNEQLKQMIEAQGKEIKKLREFVAGKGLESVSQLEYKIDDAEEFNRMYRKVKALMLVVGIEVDAYGGVKFVEPLERK